MYVQVSWYALFGRSASGSNVKVRLNDTHLTGLGVPVRCIHAHTRAHTHTHTHTHVYGHTHAHPLKADCSYECLPSVPPQVPAGRDCKLTVEGLKTNEMYVFAVAAYTQDGHLVGDTIGATSQPILSAFPMPHLAGLAYLCKVCPYTVELQTVGLSLPVVEGLL